MKIRTQFTITVVLFGITLIAIAAFLLFTNWKVERLQKQEAIAHDIELASRELSYLSNDYLLHRESQIRTRWETKFSSFSKDLLILTPADPEQVALVNKIKGNQQQLKAVFSDVVSTLESVSLTQGTVSDMAFIRVSWSRMEVQNQGIAFDASRLARVLEDEADRLRQRSITLITVLIGVFGAFLVVGYAMVHRRILRALSDLQAGTRVIGSGDLGFTIEEKKADEIGELSRAFNNMTASLRDITASKADLEREIGERKQAEEALRDQREWLRVTLSSIGDAVMTTDTQGRITFLNPVAQSLTGRQLEEAAGQPADTVFRIINERTRKPAENIIERVLREECVVTLANHTALLTSDGREIPIEDSAAPIRDGAGNLLGVVLVFHDVTEKRRAQEALRKAHDELELRVRERTAALRATVTRLELMNQELQEFAFVASHDLQEPLRKIQTFCDMAAKRCSPALDDTAKGYLERVLNSASRMRQLLDDLLQFSRVATRSEPFKGIDLSEIARESAGVFEAGAGKAGALIEIENMPTIEADEIQMLRLFQNLIGNALKFCNSEAPHIKVYARPDGQGNCEIFVKDNGIGFDQQFAERIFKPFQRLHNRKEYEGTGMGLAICRKIAERHGGSIRAESEPGRGSTFIVRLPVKQDRWEGI